MCVRHNCASQGLSSLSSERLLLKPTKVANGQDACLAFNSNQQGHGQQQHESSVTAAQTHWKYRSNCRSLEGATEQLPIQSFNLSGLPAAWLRCLFQQHLDPADRLHLFQTAKANAAAVMQHAARPALSLAPKPATLVERLRVKMPALGMIKRLASFAQKNLRLHVAEDTFNYFIPKTLFSEVPKHNVIQLTFSEMSLTPMLLKQLKEFNNLCALTLGPYCEFSHTSKNEMAQLSVIDAWLPAPCTKLRLFHEGTRYCAKNFVPLMAPRITHLIIQPRTKLHKTSTKFQRNILSLLPQFTALSHMATPWDLEVGGPVHDALAATATLTHVAVGNMVKSDTEEHGNSDQRSAIPKNALNVAWKELQVQCCCLEDLMQFPLGNIDQVIITGGKVGVKTGRPASVSEQYTTQLTKLPNLQILPGKFEFVGYRWPVQPENCSPEQLQFTAAEIDAGVYTPELKQLCMRSVVDGLCIGPVTFHEGVATSHMVADSMKHFSPTVDTVMLVGLHKDDDWEHSCELLVTSLPRHVKKLVMEKLEYDSGKLCSNAALLTKHLAAARHPAVLYVLLANYNVVYADLQQAVAAYPDCVRVYISKTNHTCQPTTTGRAPQAYDTWLD